METKLINFSVTQKDIDDGIGGSCSECAVALAITRRLKCPVKVGTASFQPFYFSLASVFLPNKIISFISKFDAQKRNLPSQLILSPIKFRIRIPISWLNDFTQKRKDWLASQRKKVK